MNVARSQPAGKRLLFVAAEAAFFVTHRLQLALAAREHGYDVHVATPRGRLLEAIRDHRFPWHPIVMTRATRMMREIVAIPDLVALYLRVRPDMVHHIAMKAILYGTMAARISRVPAVVNSVTGLGYAFDPVRARSILGRSVSFGFSQFFTHRNMRVIFQNIEDREVFVARGWARPEQTLLIQGSGVDANVFFPMQRDSDAAPIVIFVSRLLFAKGIVQFVEAAHRVKSIACSTRFAVIGAPDPDNPDSVSNAQIEAWSKDSVVEMWGWRDDIPEVLRGASIFVLPTYYGEGIPRALIEAAASGLPAVTTDMPGCRDVVVHGETGLLVPPRDAGALADAILALLADGSKRRAMGSRARERVLERFTLDRIIAATLGTYDHLLSETAATLHS